MLATQMHHWFQEDKLRPNCLIELVNHVYQKMPSSANKLLVCIEIKVVGQLDSPLISTGGPVNPSPAPAYTGSSVPSYGSAPPSVYSAPSYGQTPAYGQAPSYAQTNVGAPISYGQAAYGQVSGQSGAPAYGQSAFGTSKGPVVKDESSSSMGFTPISAITPYSNKLVPLTLSMKLEEFIMYSSRWTIKARVTRKTDIKRWSNAKGEGTLFSVDLTDASSSIR
jgi:replication factor A1